MNPRNHTNLFKKLAIFVGVASLSSLISLPVLAQPYPDQRPVPPLDAPPPGHQVTRPPRHKGPHHLHPQMRRQPRPAPPLR